ncbi:MAG: hypothetical protein QOK43_827 [Acidimicrobiaceae bacterium]|nr:hypothetical protein [Acidimicrobiaceae bacterium]MDQ1446609.1 hypothetical protein [Acidimicrobiaceae bacterium]
MSGRAVALDFWSDDVAGFAGLWIDGRRAEYWAGLVGRGRPYVLVKELDVVPPRRADSWEIRAEGLWADHNCETAGEHWSFGLEAFGLAFDSADDALHADWGDRMALGLDVEWEAPDVVHGEVLVGSERIAFDGSGRFSTDADAGTGADHWRRWVAWPADLAP